MKYQEQVDKLRNFVSLAGKASSIEKLVLDLADEITQLEAENERIWGEKNHWWRLACVRGAALQEISEMIEKPPGSWTAIDAAIMHEKAEETLRVE